MKITCMVAYIRKLLENLKKPFLKIRKIKAIYIATAFLNHFQNSPSYLRDIVWHHYSISQKTAVLPRVRTTTYGLRSFRKFCSTNLEFSAEPLSIGNIFWTLFIFIWDYLIYACNSILWYVIIYTLFFMFCF